MKSQLTPVQAAAFRDRIRSMLRFLSLCRQRLDTAGYDPNGPLYAAVARAYEAIHALHMELHYQSIPHGVGRPPAGE
jgi:hypothetical protein